MLPKRVDNIVEAVKLVGMRGIKNLLYSYGTQKILNSHQKWLWDHSYKTAYYAYNLAKNFKRKKDILDDAYVGGILHDMGKIVFANVHPNLLQKIARFCREHEIEKDFFEDISAGLNHAEIGGKIAEKWNFPDPLIESIRYHHEPLTCSPQYIDVVYTVYLVNCLCNMENNELVFDQIEKEVLKSFGIENEEQLLLIQKRLEKGFNQNKS
jgi:putative nucleotidyltransferase with HDIG domain